MNGGGPADLRELSVELAAWMFCLADRTPNIDEGRQLADDTHSRPVRAEEISRDRACSKVATHRRSTIPGVYPRPFIGYRFRARPVGFVEAIQCEQVGIASLILGGGREKKEDLIDPAVGLVLQKKVGDPVQKGEPLCIVHHNSEARLESAMEYVAEGVSYRGEASGRKASVDPSRHLERRCRGMMVRPASYSHSVTKQPSNCRTRRREWAV